MPKWKWTEERVEQFLIDYARYGPKKTAEKYNLKYSSCVETHSRLINGKR